MQTTLLTYENRLEQLNSFNNLNISQSYVNLTKSENHFDSGRGNSRGSNFKGPGGGKGRGRFTHNNKPTCQVCEKLGHTAISFFYKFDKAYMTSSFTIEQSKTHEQATTYIATPNTVSDLAWYMDSGASSHITNNIHLIESPSVNNGKNKLVIKLLFIALVTLHCTVIMRRHYK